MHNKLLLLSTSRLRNTGKYVGCCSNVAAVADIEPPGAGDAVMMGDEMVETSSKGFVNNMK
jgi:hypothetical protein